MANILVFSGVINEDPREYLVAFKHRCVSLNFLIEDRWLMVLPIFLDEDVFLDIEKQCNRVWFDVVDGTNMVPKEVGYKDKTKELSAVMPIVETFEVFPDGLLLDLEREMQQCMQESVWDSVLRDITYSSPYRQMKGVEYSPFQTRGVELYINL